MSGSQPPAAPQTGDAAVGICYDAVMELHMRAGHPEHPERTKQLVALLQDGDRNLLSRCHRLPARAATQEEIARAHRQGYSQQVQQLYTHGAVHVKAEDLEEDEEEQYEDEEQQGDTKIITQDIYCNRHTALAASTAAGCAAEAVQQVLDGAVQRAFAVVRPPGHHAGPETFSGFCFYNNIAVAAHTALARPGIERVLILDWDVHHGNGTQAIFYQDPRVLTISLHRRDRTFYPEGSGFIDEAGEGLGAGFNINIGWSKKGVGDLDYMAAFELIVEPVLSSWKPQLVLVAAGFDAADGDPLGGCCVTPAGFAWMTSRLLRYAGGRCVAVLEGGYNPRLVSECAAEVVAVMLGAAPPDNNGSLALHECTLSTLSRVEDVQQQYWRCLRQATPLRERLALFIAGMCLKDIRLRPRMPGGLAATPGSLPLAAAYAASKAKAAAGATGGADAPAAGAARGAARLTRAAAAAAVEAGGRQPQMLFLEDAALPRRSSKPAATSGSSPGPAAALRAATVQQASAAPDLGSPAPDAQRRRTRSNPAAAAAGAAADGAPVPLLAAGGSVGLLSGDARPPSNDSLAAAAAAGAPFTDAAAPSATPPSFSCHAPRPEQQLQQQQQQAWVSLPAVTTSPSGSPAAAAKARAAGIGSAERPPGAAAPPPEQQPASSTTPEQQQQHAPGAPWPVRTLLSQGRGAALGLSSPEASGASMLAAGSPPSPFDVRPAKSPRPSPTRSPYGGSRSRLPPLPPGMQPTPSALAAVSADAWAAPAAAAAAALDDTDMEEPVAAVHIPPQQQQQQQQCKPHSREQEQHTLHLLKSMSLDPPDALLLQPATEPAAMDATQAR